MIHLRLNLESTVLLFANQDAFNFLTYRVVVNFFPYLAIFHLVIDLGILSFESIVFEDCIIVKYVFQQYFLAKEMVFKYIMAKNLTHHKYLVVTIIFIDPCIGALHTFFFSQALFLI